MEQIVKDLRKADAIIKKRTRYNCGLVSEEEKAGLAPSANFFFESPDGQNGELFYELKKLGFESAGYNAEYFWKVQKDGFILGYTEGDINIYQIKK